MHGLSSTTTQSLLSSLTIWQTWCLYLAEKLIIKQKKQICLTVTLLVVFSVVVPQYFLNAVILSDVHYCKHPADVSDAFYDTQSYLWSFWSSWHFLGFHTIAGQHNWQMKVKFLHCFKFHHDWCWLQVHGYGIWASWINKIVELKYPSPLLLLLPSPCFLLKR